MTKIKIQNYHLIYLGCENSAIEKTNKLESRKIIRKISFLKELRNPELVRK